MSKNENEMNPLPKEEQPVAVPETPDSVDATAPAATLAERALALIGKEGHGDIARAIIMKDKTARHFEKFEPVAGSPEVGDIAVLYRNANTPRCYGIVVKVGEGPWHEIAYAQPLGGRDTVLTLSSSAAGVTTSHQGLWWDSSWKCAGFIRP